LGVNLRMQSTLVRVTSAKETITSHPPRRVGFVTEMDQQSVCSRNHNSQELRPAAQRVGLAIQHMVQHLNEPLRISTLAAVTGVSPSHFFSLFKSATGFTPIAFFTGLRIQRACELLRDPQLSIKEAADLIGYGDQFYFTRVFKQVIGIPPSEYRRTLLRSSEKTPVGVPSKRGKELQRLPSLAFAFSTMKDLGIVTAPEAGDVPVGVRSNNLKTVAFAPH